MTKQSEAILEQNLINQLVGLGYHTVVIPDGSALVNNLKKQLGFFNQTSFSDKEFSKVLIHLEKGQVFEKAKTLRGRFQFTNDAGKPTYIRFFNSEDWTKNLFQVTHQITQEGTCKNQFNALVESYIYSGQEPIRDEVFNCFDNRPSILKAREIGERIIEKMKQFVQTFVHGMVG